MKFLLLSIIVACVLAGAYANLPRDVFTLLKDGKTLAGKSDQVNWRINGLS